MNELISKFIISMDSGDVWIGFLVLAIFYILKKEPFKIIEYVSERKSRDIDQAKALLESNKLSKESNEFIKEYVESCAFKKYYGITADDEMRASLLSFYQKNKKAVSWQDIKSAYKYFDRDSIEIDIKLNWRDRFGRWIVSAISMLIGIYSLTIIVLAVMVKFDDKPEFLSLTFFSIVLLGAAMFYGSLNWPYHAAVKIKKVIMKNN